MCGIGGIVSLTGEPVDELLLARMANIIRYRGPDDQGFFLHDSVGFFHNRLSIIDLETGHQPLCNEDETVWIVFNGEIYNYIELRVDLQKRGHLFRSHSDTEVIVHLYEEYGVKCLDHLNGMFALAIWDKTSSELFLARDRLGIKPLYYYYDGARLVFASEIKSILLHPQIATKLNYQGLVDYLTFQYTLKEKTLFQNIVKLQPGHYLKLKGAQLQLSQYWDIVTGEYQERSLDDWSDAFRDLLQDSVRLRLRSDVPLGAHLSGGVDSGSLTCIASRLLGGRLKTFSAGFTEGGIFHDLDFCQLTSKAANTEHFEIFPQAADFAEILPTLVWHMDEPAAAEGIFPQYHVSRLASSRVKVVLGGQGGDEILGGYTRYYLMYLEAALKNEIQGSGEKLDLKLADLLPQLSQLQKYQPLMESFFKNDLFGESDARYYRLIKRGDVQELLHPEVQKQVGAYSAYEEYRSIFNSQGHAPLLDRILYYECKTSLTALLQVEDRTSMAVSLESRVPFLDHRLVELAFQMPPHIKLHQGQMKHILKRSMQGIVPEKILTRPDKLGFPVPLKSWSENELSGFIHELLDQGELVQRGLLEPRAIKKYLLGKQPFNRVLWGLLNLELWLRLFEKKEGFSQFSEPFLFESRLSLS